MSSDDRVLEYSGAYRLVNKIAEGGMAAVYEAQQLGPEGFAKRIALKVIHPEYGKQREFLQLFIDEAKLSANLLHGNIVQIYQLGEVGGEYFIAMEFIQGPTLRAVIDRHCELGRAIPATLAAYVASRVCRALDFAHNFVLGGKRLDIVHRDVSPGNVMATWDGHIKLADFGIAKAQTSIDPTAKDGMRLGKKHYMSPEQLLGLDVDARSDVFSVGVVLYELLALDALFHEDLTLFAVEEVAMQPLPDLQQRISDLDEGLARILRRALSREPAQRFTAAAMGRALDDWIASQHEIASPDRLQAHLASIFPSTYQARSAEPAANTDFSFLKNASRKQRGSLLGKLFG